MKCPKLLAVGLAAILAFSAASGTQAFADLERGRLAPDLLDRIEAYQAEQQSILESRQALGEEIRDLGPVERRARIEAFQQENAERLAVNRALGEEIRLKVQELRASQESPERPAPRERPRAEAQPQTPSNMQSLVDNFSAARDELMEQIKQERERLRQERADLRELQREEAKQLREETRQNPGRGNTP